MRAETVGDPGPRRQQALLGQDRWETNALRDIVREYVVERLVDDERAMEDSDLRRSQQLAGGMIERAIAVRVGLVWIAANVVYGVSDIENILRRAG
jgi:SRSO17 transposase